MPRRARGQLIALASGVVACAPTAVDLGGNDAPVPAPTETDVRCQHEFVGAPPPSSDSALLGALYGTWVRCEGDPHAASPLQYPGLELVDTGFEHGGQWFGLQADARHLVRATEDSGKGSFVVAAPVSVDLRFDNQSTTNLVVLLDAQAQTLRVVRRFLDPVDVRYVRAAR